MVPKGQFHTKDTLCWSCQHAVPNYEGTRGCAWSQDGEPVAGWTAEPSDIKYSDGYGTGFTRSYRVIDCPQFLPDEKRGPEA